MYISKLITINLFLNIIISQFIQLMRKFPLLFFIGLIAMLLPTAALARQISSSEARQIAERFQQKGSATPTGATPVAASLKLAYTATTEQSATPAYYVFERGNNAGFIIVSADDRLRDILGYSYSDKFDPNDMPGNMKWWLDEYKREITAYLKYLESPEASKVTTTATLHVAQPVSYTPVNGPLQPKLMKFDDGNAQTAATPASDPSQWSAIAPLVTAQWNQGEPFNNMCPTYSSERAVTGCVATAMAQIMYYHKWPQGPGSGSYSYVHNGASISFDFGATTFDWNNMIDNYNSSYTNAQGRAVAQLMAACGTSIRMQYAPGGSASYDNLVSWALVKYFGYDADTRFVMRDGYTLDEWNELIYNELSNDRPVLLGGQADSGGHAFVCDGYEGNGYFHINWGWGGYQDGHFTLSALNPDGQGIGGFEGGYNSSQDAAIGIQPPFDGSEERLFYVLTDGEFSSTGNHQFHLDGRTYTRYPEAQAVTYAIEVVPENGGESQMFASSTTLNMPASTLDGYFTFYNSISFTATPSGLSPGKYKVYPAFIRSNSTWDRIRCPETSTRYVDLTVSEAGDYIYGNSTPDAKADIKVTEFMPNGNLSPTTQPSFKITIVNNGDGAYSGDINLRVLQNQSAVASIRLTGISIAPGSSLSGTFTISKLFEPGTYDAFFTDSAGNPINASEFSFTIPDGSGEPDGELTLYGFSPDKFYKGYSCRLDFKIANTSSSIISTNLTFNIYAPNQTTPAMSVNVGSVSIDPNTDEGYYIPGWHTSDLPAGQYELVVTDDNGNELGERAPIAIFDYEQGLWFGTDGTEAQIVANPEGAYTETLIRIPATIEYNGATLNVTAIADEAFYNCTNLHTIFIEPAAMLFGNAESVFSALPDDAEFYVAHDAYDAYATALSPLGRNVYLTINRLECDYRNDPLALKTGKEFRLLLRPVPTSTQINPNFSVDITNNLLEPVAQTPADGNIEFVFKAVNAGSGTMVITSEQPGLAPLTVPLKIADDDTPIEFEITAERSSIHVDETLQLTTNLAEGSTPEWSSSDTSVATVDANGLVTAVSAGKATITATLGNSSATFDITVTLKPSELNYEVTSEEDLTCKVVSNNYSYSGDIVIPATTEIDGKTYQVTEIGNGAFGYSNITSVIIPEGILTINVVAFEHCSKLTSITIPASVKYINENPFRSSSSLMNINVDADNQSYKSVDGVLFSKNGKSILAYPGGRYGEYDIPTGTEIIGQDAFSGCKISKINIPNTVTKIKQWGIAYSDVTEIHIPESVLYLGYEAISYHNNHLTKITVDDNNPHYMAINNVLFNKSIPDNEKEGITGYETYMSHIIACAAMKEGTYTIPESVTHLDPSSFDYTRLSSVIMGDNVVYIGRRAFYTSDIESITLSANIETLEYSVFCHCRNLKSLTIPDKVVKIATQLCLDLTSCIDIVIGESVSTIGRQAFKRSNLGTGDYKITSLNPAPPTLDDDEVFSDEDYTGTTLYVPKGSLDAYRNADGWKNFVTIKELGSDVKPTSITLNTTTETLEKDEALQLTAYVHPDDAEMPTLVWSSADESIATVDQSGLVTAVAAGSTVITVHSADDATLGASCSITVTDKSGIDGVDNGEVKIRAVNGAIEVSSVEAGTEIMVYNASGRLMALRRAEAATTRISLEKGIYIVRVTKHTAKISL